MTNVRIFDGFFQDVSQFSFSRNYDPDFTFFALSLQGRGLGEAEFAPALTSAGAEAMLDEGTLPYYGTSASNIPSMRTAIAVGFKPTWVEVLSPASED